MASGVSPTEGIRAEIDALFAADRSVGAVMVVQVQLGVQSISSLGVSPIGPLVGPLGQQGGVSCLV